MSISRNPWFWATLAILAAVRLYAVAVYPATGFPDRHGYIAFMHYILAGSDWIHALENSALPTTGFRALGYPVILALSNLAVGDGYATLLQIVQTTATLAACTLVFPALRRLTGRNWQAALAVLGFGLSVNLAYELSILPDAFSIAAWIALLAVTLTHWLDGQPLRPPLALGLGLLGLYIVMARGNGLHLLFLTLPIVALATLQPGTPLPRRVGALLLVFLPGILAYQSVSAWNVYRTGERFFTTGAQIALIQPVFRMAQLGADPFRGDDLLSRLFRERAPELRYEQIYEINTALYSEFGMTPKQIAGANMALYLRTVRNHPAIFAKMFVVNFDDKFAAGLVNPAFGLHEAHRLVLGERAFPGFSSIVKGRETGFSNMVYALVYGPGMAASFLLFVGAVLIAPVRAVSRLLANRRRGFPAREEVAIIALWTICMAVLAYYCALFMVLRYVILTTPFLIAVGLWAFRPRMRKFT